MKLQKISILEAENLFNSGIVTYVTIGNEEPNSFYNTFMLSNRVKDGSLNIYTGGKKVSEIPFNEYVSFIKEKTEKELFFYTYNSTEFLIVE